MGTTGYFNETNATAQVSDQNSFFDKNVVF